MINFIFTSLYAHGGDVHETQVVEHAESFNSMLITLHPKLVHFPIALIMLVLLFEFLWFLKKKDFFDQSARWLFQLGLIASVLSAGAGLLSANIIGHSSPDHSLVHDHRNIMLAASILWLIGSGLLQFWPAYKEKLRILFRITIIVIVALFIWGSTEGGELVYEKGIGVEPVMKTWQKKSPLVNQPNNAGHIENDHH